MGVKYDNEEKPEYSFFSVKNYCTIGGVRHRPSICYPIQFSLASTIESMEKKGMATRYTEEMRFVSGSARPVKKA
jgi:hypothetical protein